MSQEKTSGGPFKLISSRRAGSVPGKRGKGTKFMVEDMIIMHNIIMRGLNSIYLQCVNVARDEAAIPHFVSYSLQWCALLEEHHETEEKWVFPAIEKTADSPGLMAVNVEQHGAFHTGAHDFQTYLKKVAAGTETYNGEHTRALIDSFGSILQQHLDEEIDTLLDLARFEDKADWGEMFEKLMDGVLKRANEDPKIRVEALPFALQNHDATYEDGIYAHWPPVPWFVIFVLRWFFVPKNKAWWQFSSCDPHCKPRKLPYA